MQYEEAVQGFIQKKQKLKEAHVSQSGVLVTVYSVHARRKTDDVDGNGNSTGAARQIVKALQVALSQHLQRHKNSQATVTVVLANKKNDVQNTNSTALSDQRRLSETDEVQSLSLELGIVIQGLDWAHHEPIEEMLEQQESLSAVKNGMNEELGESDFSVQQLKPGVMTTGILLTVECGSLAASEHSERTACGEGARTWQKWVYDAAAVKELQAPEDVWVLKKEVNTEPTVLAGDFQSLHVTKEKSRVPVGIFVMLGAATAAVAVLALGVYAMFTRMHYRKGGLGGYQSMRGGVAMPVAESVPSAWSPRILRQPWQSSLCKRPKGMKAWQEAAVSASSPTDGDPATTQPQPSWLRSNSGRTMRASSLQSFAIDPLRLDGLRTTSLEQVPIAGGDPGTEIVSTTPRTTTSDAGSTPPAGAEFVHSYPAASRYVPMCLQSTQVHIHN